MRDYWLGKLFFDLQNPEAAKEYRSGREEVLKRYPLKEDVRQAVMSDDVTFLALRVNAYLLRFYFQSAGMPDGEFIQRLKAGAAQTETQNG